MQSDFSVILKENSDEILEKFFIDSHMENQKIVGFFSTIIMTLYESLNLGRFKWSFNMGSRAQT